jgi:AraC family transcriptional regulator, regulatory protein of adaptative response / methylated-DNA-[protein]-cysteine methyltransferase
MAFAGFGSKALPFFKALKFHQSREWFEANRATYESAIRGPMGNLVEDVVERLGQGKIPIKGDRKSSLFRIHRDVRFSPNKDPYKTHAGAVLTRSGGKNDPGLLYFHLSPEECFFAAGFYLPDPDKLGRLRAAAARGPKEFKAMTRMLKKAGLKLSARIRSGARLAASRRSTIPRSPPQSGSRAWSACVRSERRRSPPRRWSTISAPSRAMRCRCSNGAGTRLPTCARVRPIDTGQRPTVVFGWRAPSERGMRAEPRAQRTARGAIGAPMLDIPKPPTDCADYATVKRAIEFISKRYRDQPSIEAVADHVGLSPSHFQHVFKRWAGLTPKAFLQAITLERARELLRDSASVLDAAYDVGLSGPSRLHDLFVAHEALTPGDYRRDDLMLAYGFHPSPFGEAIVVAAPRGMAGLGFVDEGKREAALADMARRWPRARLIEDERMTAPYAARAFDPTMWRPDAPLRVVLIGTDFELRVWETLLSVPMGRATTYSDIARKIGKPTAARAVGAAVGKNPISFVVPCHRVLGRSGALTGYHWGLARKQAIIGWEAGRTAA